MKKLENEYRQLMQNEVPDLWSRIEAGVDAKIAENGKIEENKKRKVINWKKYSLPLVACIAAILCVPLLLTGVLRMTYGGKAESAEMEADCAVADYAAADCAAPEETISVTTDTCAAVVTDEVCDEEVDDAYEENFEMTSDDSVAMAESQLMEEPESMLDGTTTSGATDEYKQNKEEVSELLQILTVINISKEQDETASGHKEGMIYYLDTEEVGECTIYVPVDVEFVTDMDVQLKIQVEASGEDYDFVFVGIAE